MQNEVKTNQNKIIETLSKIFGSSPVLQIEIDSIRSLINEKKAENNEQIKSSTDVQSKTLVTFSVIERAQNGQTRRIPSLDVFNYLNKQEAPSGALGSLATKTTIKDQLNQIGILNVYPLVQLNEEQIKEYLDKPPSGINPILWEQAKRNNPNPNKLIPVPIIGFKELNKRFKLQEQENQAQKSCLYNLKEDIETINTKNRLLMNKIEQYKNKNEELEHRLLKVMINYEIRRKLGICFQEDEKYLRNVLESLYIELSSPINKEIQKQKLNEFLEIVKSYELNNLKQHQQQQIKSDNKIDLNNLEGIQHSLRDQHKIFKSLIEIINKDLNDLNLIKRNIQA
jgi:nuclear pore complex protein Nup54